MARSSLNSPIPLPKSDAPTDGMTSGSTGGASEAAVKRGYTTITDEDAMQFDRSAMPALFRDPSTNTRPWLGNPDVCDDERDDNT